MKNSIQQQAVRGVPFCSFYSTSFAFSLPDRKLTEAAAFPCSFLPPRELSRCLLVSSCGCPSLSPGCPSLITQPIIGSNGRDLLLVPLMKGLSCRNYLHASLRAQAPWAKGWRHPVPRDITAPCRTLITAQSRCQLFSTRLELSLQCCKSAWSFPATYKNVWLPPAPESTQPQGPAKEKGHAPSCPVPKCHPTSVAGSWESCSWLKALRVPQKGSEGSDNTWVRRQCRSDTFLWDRCYAQVLQCQNPRDAFRAVVA